MQQGGSTEITAQPHDDESAPHDDDALAHTRSGGELKLAARGDDSRR
jgi:hypothetical protein